MALLGRLQFYFGATRLPLQGSGFKVYPPMQVSFLFNALILVADKITQQQDSECLEKEMTRSLPK